MLGLGAGGGALFVLHFCLRIEEALDTYFKGVSMFSCFDFIKMGAKDIYFSLLEDCFLMLGGEELVHVNA